MEKCTIGKATPSQAEALSTISIAAKRHWGYPDAWLDAWTEELTLTPDYIAQHHVYTLSVADAVMGFIALGVHQDYVEIEHLWISPEHIGKGFGQRLLQATIALLVAPGKEMRVLADPFAEGFYLKQGFHTYATKEGYPAGRRLPLMRKVYPGINKSVMLS